MIFGFSTRAANSRPYGRVRVCGPPRSPWPGPYGRGADLRDVEGAVPYAQSVGLRDVEDAVPYILGARR